MTYVALLGQHEHYIDAEGERAVIGRVRHRASRRVLRARGIGRGILLTVSKKHREAAIRNSNDKTEVIPQVQTPTNNLLAMAESFTQVFAPVMTGMQPPEKPRSRWQRFKGRVVGSVTDAEWHQTARRCAGTVLMWGFTVTSFIIFGKAALWVLFL
jgi:hypothetical protein